VGAAVPLLPRRSAIASAITAAMLSLIAISLLIVACGAVKPPLVPRRLYKDWVALNARSTTRHIMRPRTPAGRQECIALKTELAAAQAAGAFVVDAFAAAATDQSADADSAPSGGLLGTRLRQGTCTLPELDRACFCSPLGRVTGPLETSLGWHLVLVEERIGLEMHDSGMSRVVRAPLPSGGVDSVLAPPDDDEPNELVAPDVLLNVAGFFALSYVGGQAIGSWATSIDLEKVASAVG